MRAHLSAALLVGALYLMGCGPAGPTDGEVRLESSDGLKVFADWYTTDTKNARGVLVLFHQGGGDARGEYVNIIPRLVSGGYDVLAADLRRGGSRFGTPNRTAPPQADSLYSYCDAYADVEAALVEAWRFDDAPVLWGSSFSGALVVQAASRHPDRVAGVLGFSPASGDPMEGCRPESFARDLAVPLFVARPIGEMEFGSVRNQISEFRAMGHITYVADPGVHGASMLDEERVGASTATTWREVEAFLDGLHPKREAG